MNAVPLCAWNAVCVCWATNNRKMSCVCTYYSTLLHMNARAGITPLTPKSTLQLGQTKTAPVLVCNCKNMKIKALTHLKSVKENEGCRQAFVIFCGNIVSWQLCQACGVPIWVCHRKCVLSFQNKCQRIGCYQLDIFKSSSFTFLAGKLFYMLQLLRNTLLFLTLSFAAAPLFTLHFSSSRPASRTAQSVLIGHLSQDWAETAHCFSATAPLVSLQIPSSYKHGWGWCL